jgi:hypothetical protein
MGFFPCGSMTRCSASWEVTSKLDPAFNCEGTSSNGWVAEDAANIKLSKLEAKLRRKRPNDCKIAVISNR